MQQGDELTQLAKTVADRTVGEGAVEQVDVATGEDIDSQPTYIFSFLINPRRATMRPGLLHIRLVQSLRDALVARSDTHYPVVRLLDSKDWASRAVA